MKAAILLTIGLPLLAQEPMSLNQAVAVALRNNAAIKASEATQKAADSRIAEARAGRLPKVNYSESWARSDNPVFVFSSLLTQHQFGEQNFQIGPLNRPDYLNNFQSLVTATNPCTMPAKPNARPARPSWESRSPEKAGG